MRYDIFTDGSCKGNPGPGGYAFVVTVSNSTEQKIIYEYSGGELKTTNNRMELLSIIKALTYAKNKLLKKRITDFKDYRFRKILIKVNNDYMCNEKINYCTYIESLKVIDKYVNNFIIY